MTFDFVDSLIVSSVTSSPACQTPVASLRVWLTGVRDAELGSPQRQLQARPAASTRFSLKSLDLWPVRWSGMRAEWPVTQSLIRPATPDQPISCRTSLYLASGNSKPLTCKCVVRPCQNFWSRSWLTCLLALPALLQARGTLGSAYLREALTAATFDTVLTVVPFSETNAKDTDAVRKITATLKL